MGNVMEPTAIEIAECYQPLFDLMDKEHGRILTISEMDEIISTCSIVVINMNEINPPK
jgi:hypothetical protein